MATSITPVFHSNRLTGATRIAESIRENACLKELCLAGNKLGPLAASSFGECLRENHALTELNLGNNNLCDAGVKCLSESLKKNKGLLKLCLSINNIGSDGAKELSSMLAINKSLSELYLFGNILRDEGVRYLSSGFERNNTLIKITLGNNNIRNAGARCLVRSLSTNTSIVDLFCYGNDIDAEFRDAISSQLQANRLKQQEHYNDLLRGNQKTHWNRSRILMIGPPKSGKTSTIKSILAESNTLNRCLATGSPMNELETRLDSSIWKFSDDVTHRQYSSQHAARMMNETLVNLVSKAGRRRRNKFVPHLPYQKLAARTQKSRRISANIPRYSFEQVATSRRSKSIHPVKKISSKLNCSKPTGPGKDKVSRGSRV